MLQQVEKMLADAKREYNSAAAMHAMGKVSYYGGQIDALKKIIELLK